MPHDTDIKLEELRRLAGVPAEFPVPTSLGALPGSHPKVLMVEMDGRYYAAGVTPQELASQYEMAEDLAKQLVRYCTKKQREEPTWSRERILLAVEQAVVTNGWAAPPLAEWIVKRAAALLGW